MKTLGDRIRLARTQKGAIWTQAHLGQVVGLSKAAIGMLERSQRGNSGRGLIPGSIHPIAKALGVNYDWLAHGTGAMLMIKPVALADTESATDIRNTTLGDRIKLARTRKGDIWTHRQLGIAAGTSPATISMMERGLRGVSERGTVPGSIPPIAKALGVNYEWLAHGTGPMYVSDTAAVAPLTPSTNLLGPLNVLLAIYEAIPAERKGVAIQAAIRSMAPFMHSDPSAGL